MLQLLTMKHVVHGGKMDKTLKSAEKWAISESQIRGKPYFLMELAQAGELFDFGDALVDELQRQHWPRSGH
jgi:hypothetical protein